MIRYDTRSYFNVRSKADISQLNLPHETKLKKVEKKEKRQKKQAASPLLLANNIEYIDRWHVSHRKDPFPRGIRPGPHVALGLFETMPRMTSRSVHHFTGLTVMTNRQSRYNGCILGYIL